MNKKCVLLSLFLLLLLTACGQNQQNLDEVNTTNLSDLENVQYQPIPPSSSPSTQVSGLRLKVLQDSALSIGAQGGLSWASDQMNIRMDQDRRYLDTIFNFNAMMLTHGVIPPVLEEGDFTLNLADPNTIRVSDRTYKIVEQARFATTAPNWRDYLRLAYSKPDLPDKSLLPRNINEQKVWRKSVQVGWEKGIVQAYSIFQQNLSRLKRDYRGMLLYRKLLQEKMISAPFVSRTDLGVTGDGSKMNINDQVLRIVELPQLQTNSRHWKAIIVRGHD